MITYECMGCNIEFQGADEVTPACPMCASFRDVYVQDAEFAYSYAEDAYLDSYWESLYEGE